MTTEDAHERVPLERRLTDLCERYSLMLSKAAFALGADADDAVAIADDAVLTLVDNERRDDRAPIDNEEAWLRRVVRNKVADRMLRRAPQPVADVQVLAECLPGVAFSSPEQHLDAMEVLRALQSIREFFRVPVWLAAQGWSAKEIGDLLGITERTAWQRVSRGRKILRALTGYELPQQTQDRIEEGRTA